MKWNYCLWDKIATYLLEQLVNKHLRGQIELFIQFSKWKTSPPPPSISPLGTLNCIYSHLLNCLIFQKIVTNSFHLLGKIFTKTKQNHLRKKGEKRTLRRYWQQIIDCHDIIAAILNEKLNSPIKKSSFSLWLSTFIINGCHLKFTSTETMAI